MYIINGLVFTDDFVFKHADIELKGDRIAKIAPAGSLPAKGAVDAAGGFILPGFVDIHTHGAKGEDFSCANPQAVETMLEYYGSCGVTSLVPATTSLDKKQLDDTIEAILPYFDKDGYGAVVRGVNLEGPFISSEKKGAQNGAYIIQPSLNIYQHLQQLSANHIRLVDVAPEIPGCLEFIREISHKCTLSIAHTNATYEQAKAAFDAGATHVTHLFNAMPPLDHREPGVIGAAADFARFVEIISDGVHLHPAVVRATFKLFGAERICLISDSMSAAGMPDGTYTMGGQKVIAENGKAKLQDGTIAGGISNLAACCRKAVEYGVPLEHAVRAATINPAKAVGLDHEVGSLMPGKRADLLIWNRDMQPCQVIVGGKTIWE